MRGSIRFGYNFGQTVGTGFAKLLEVVGRRKRYSKKLGMNMSGQVIVRGELRIHWMVTTAFS